MKKHVVLAAVLCAAGAGWAATADIAPNPGVAPPGASGYNPAFGNLIRSWTISDSGSSDYDAMGVTYTYDNYLCVGSWNDWDHFAVYTTLGSLVRTVAVSTPKSYFDGSGACHLGNNYIVTMHRTAGPYYFPYAAGGTPGSTGTPLFTGPTGCGIAWDGTYYYATMGGWGSDIGKYTSTGSLVKRLIGPYATGLVGICAYPDAAYIYCISQGHYFARVDKNTGSIIETASTETILPEGGGDMGPEGGNNYLYIVLQSGPTHSLMQVRDADETGAAATPTSLGKIKTLYR